MNYWIDSQRTFNPSNKQRLPLIHMTQQWETLELIVSQGFKPSYCIEVITDGINSKTAAFPMISLSNMSVADAIQSQKSYGTFGIALNHSWGQENDFNPVLYLDRYSNLTKEIINSFDYIKANSPRELLNITDGMGVGLKHVITRNTIKLFAHTKNYDGKLVRQGRLDDETYPFGLEREWRKIIVQDNIPYFLLKEDYGNKRDFNNLLNNVRVDFKLKDLKGIIVENNDQRDAVEDLILKKFDIEKLPNDILIQINSLRHVPDEG